MSETEMLTVAEVAARLRVPPATVRRWLREGRLRGAMLGGTKLGYRIARRDLDNFIERGYGSEGNAAA